MACAVVWYQATDLAETKFDILEGAEHGDTDFETAENMERIVDFLYMRGV